MQWNLTTFLVLLGVLFAGYAIGLLEMHLRRRRKIRQLEAALNASIAVPPPAALPALLRLSGSSPADQTLELDGQSFASPAALSPTQRRRLITLLNGLRPWVQGEVAPAPAPDAPAPAPAAKPTAKPPAETGEPASALSMIAQIDALLQARLAGTPLASQRIRLSETLSGGVLFTIGTTRYQSLEEIPDAQVVAAIRAAIAEWEKKVR